jgi:hypothetical protein
MLAGDPASDGVLEYRGGVLYTEFGVAGLELDGRPSSFRCAGVRGMSERSSWGRARGSSAKTMLINGTAMSAANIQRLYCFRTGLILVKGLAGCLQLLFGGGTHIHEGKAGITICRSSPMPTRAAAL